MTTTFAVDSADFLGETVYVGRHRLDGERGTKPCFWVNGHTHNNGACGAPVYADGPARGRLVDLFESHQPRHAAPEVTS